MFLESPSAQGFVSRAQLSIARLQHEVRQSGCSGYAASPSSLPPTLHTWCAIVTQGPRLRQLATRLGISALTSRDLSSLEDLHDSGPSLETSPVAYLFDRALVTQAISAFGDLDKRLRPLTEYRQFDYWVYDEHRNPLQLVEHLRGSARHLDGRNPLHLSLLLDLAWLYLVTIGHAVEYMRMARLSSPETTLSQFLAVRLGYGRSTICRRC